MWNGGTGNERRQRLMESSHAMQPSSSITAMNDDILGVLNEIEDPELGIGIVDVGLVYRAEWTEAGIEVDITTTVPSCPFATLLRDQADRILRRRFSEASSVRVRLVSDPAWVPGRLSEHARHALGWAESARSAGAAFALRCWNGGSRLKH